MCGQYHGHLVGVNLSDIRYTTQIIMMKFQKLGEKLVSSVRPRTCACLLISVHLNTVEFARIISIRRVLVHKKCVVCMLET